MAGIDRSYLNKIENGSKLPSEDMKQKIDAVLERFTLKSR